MLIAKSNNKLPIALILILSMLMLFRISLNSEVLGYVKGSTYQHFTYMFFHGNIFHLAGNCYALYYIIKNIRHNVTMQLIYAYVCSVGASYLCYVDLPTLGFSSILFVLTGLNMYIFKQNKFSVVVFSLVVTIGFLLENVNALLHVVCFIMGYAGAYITVPIINTINDSKRINKRR
jgi:membrane associated rhomboid family serine protease